MFVYESCLNFSKAKLNLPINIFYAFLAYFRIIMVEVDKIKKFFSLSLCLILYQLPYFELFYFIKQWKYRTIFLNPANFVSLYTLSKNFAILDLRFTSGINFASFLTFKLNKINNNNFKQFLIFLKFLFRLWLLMRETPWLWTRSSLYLTKLLFCCWKVT